MGRRICLEIMDCIINYDNAKDLYNKTKFSIADEISIFWGSHKTKLIFGDVTFHISLPTFLTDADLNNGIFYIFIESYNDDAETVYNSYNSNKDEINRLVMELINGLSEELSKIVIPVNNLDNVIYDKATDAFYVKMGCAQPDTIRLSCSLEEEI